MFEKIKNIFSGIKIPARRHSEARKNSSDSDEKNEKGGKIYGLWLLILPLLVGLVFGRLADVGLSYGFEALAGNTGVKNEAVSGARGGDSSQNSTEKRGLDGFLAANPFHISPLKTEVVSEAPKPVVEVKPEEPDTGLDDVILRGTLPGVGAWLEKGGKLELLLVGKNVEKYKLMSVKYTEAVFRRGNKSVKKYITYGPVAAAKKTETPKPAAAPAKTQEPQKLGNVIAASENKEGEVSSETVNQLVQNPFDELKRIRIRPNESAGGLEVQWIQNESILKRLGVRKGDVIRSVNGIPFTNMGDIANSINSLMNSERFDVEVTRNGKPTALRYVVR